jgi:hypothetical protein
LIDSINIQQHLSIFQKGNKMTETKKTYETPALVVYGDVEKITLGEGWGLQDFVVFGICNPIGQPGESGS